MIWLLYTQTKPNKLPWVSKQADCVFLFQSDGFITIFQEFIWLPTQLAHAFTVCFFFVKPKPLGFPISGKPLHSMRSPQALTLVMFKCSFANERKMNGR